MSDVIVTYAARVSALVSRWGESISVQHGSTTLAVQCLVEVPPTTLLTQYLGMEKSQLVTPPILALVLDVTQPEVAAGDSFTLTGRAFTIQSVTTECLSGLPVATIAIAD